MKIVGQFPIRDIELIIKKGEHRTHLKLPRKTKIYALRNGGILFYCNGCSILPKGKKTAEILEIRYKRFLESQKL